MTGTLAVASPASAATYGYITYYNNCGGVRTLWIVSQATGNLVVHIASAPAGWKGTYKVTSARKYTVRAFPTDKVVTVSNIAGRVQTVSVKAC
ncbi:hypothetical protein [Micromonospora sp. NPDC005171]|uniref:hypothetical protein n=1 Tax=Micromonospora sp. NPDC005171 TaxID=3156866 RepID=UPI0033BEB824